MDEPAETGAAGGKVRRPVLPSENCSIMSTAENTNRPLWDTLNEALKREWTDQYVEVDAERPELTRFKGIVGRVVTINWNNVALIDFQDGGWYDIAVDFLSKLDPAAAKAKFDPKVNSAQVIPDKQG